MFIIKHTSDFIMEANSLNPDQTAPKGAGGSLRSGSIVLRIYILSKYFYKKMRGKLTIVVIGRKTVKDAF